MAQYLIRMEAHPHLRQGFILPGRIYYWADGMWVFDPAQARVYHDRREAELHAMDVSHAGHLQYDEPRKQEWSPRRKKAPAPGLRPTVRIMEIT